MASSPSFITPLRYPGGKGRLGLWLAELIKHNGLEDGCYVEPYAGGAGAAVYLLLNSHIDRIVINDADPVIYAFWWALLNDTERLVDLILKTPVNMDTWHEQQALVTRDCNADLTATGFATFFLNRTNRSGIIKGGVIGGKDQSGKYKIDARYNVEDLVGRIRKIAKFRDRIKLYGVDAMALLAMDDVGIDNEGLVYLDPPYYNKGSQLYRNHYKPEDHLEIAKTVLDLKTPWLVTYDNCEEINRIYEGASGVEFSIKYSTHLARPKAKEILYYGNLFLNSVPTLKR